MCVVFGYPKSQRRAAMSAAERRAVAETRAINPAPDTPRRGSVPSAGAVTGRFSHTASNPPVSETRRREDDSSLATAMVVGYALSSYSHTPSEPSAPSCSPSYDSGSSYSSSYDSGSSYSSCDSGSSYSSGGDSSF